jgi:hypothetical protein
MGDRTDGKAIMLLPITSQYDEFGFQLSSLVYKNTIDLRLLKSDLRKIPHAVDPKELNYCVNRGVSAGDTISQITGIFTFTASENLSSSNDQRSSCSPLCISVC